jgi:hypothetical protein
VCVCVYVACTYVCPQEEGFIAKILAKEGTSDIPVGAPIMVRVGVWGHTCACVFYVG